MKRQTVKKQTPPPRPPLRPLTVEDVNFRKHPATEEQIANIKKLLVAINAAQAAYGSPFVVTSGLRSLTDQQRINPSAPRSNHLMGLAVDIGDKDGKLAQWVQSNLKLMETLGLWMESFEKTIGWVHFQAVPPRSGRRVFTP